MVFKECKCDLRDYEYVVEDVVWVLELVYLYIVEVVGLEVY